MWNTIRTFPILSFLCVCVCVCVNDLDVSSCITNPFAEWVSVLFVCRGIYWPLPVRGQMNDWQRKECFWCQILQKIWRTNFWIKLTNLHCKPFNHVQERKYSNLNSPRIWCHRNIFFFVCAHRFTTVKFLNTCILWIDARMECGISLFILSDVEFYTHFQLYPWRFLCSLWCVWNIQL